MRKYTSYSRALGWVVLSICAYMMAYAHDVHEVVDDIVDAFTWSDGRMVDSIEIRGTQTVQDAMILHALPYQVGDVFDPIKTRRAIQNLFALGQFENIRLYGKEAGPDSFKLIVDVVEKKRLHEVIIEGNSAVTDKDIFKKIPFTTISSIMEAELKRYASKIKDMYHEKGYHHVIIDTELEPDEDDDHMVTALFSIDEGQRTIVKRISFEGNCAISDKELRSTIITKEDWLLSFLDKAGTYHPGKTEADKYKIEDLYQNSGFLNARVSNVETDIDPDTYYMHMIFTVDEGDQYTIGTIEAPGNDILPECVLVDMVLLKPGDLYSREKLTASIKRLEALWGDQGYIFAHINPSIQVHKDTHKVDLIFYSDIGNPIQLRRITIKGNKKTRDKVIRRTLSLQEGSLLTRRLMENSKNNISALGHFEYDGVQWKIIKQSADTADLDLVVKEAKTGHLGFQLSYGGKESNKASPASGITMTGEFSDTNLFGNGTHVNLALSWAKDDKSAQFHLAQPWLFDQPITGGFDLYHKRPSYSQLHHIKTRSIHEQLTGGSLSLGYMTPPWIACIHNMQLMLGVGIDNISYETPPVIEPTIVRPDWPTALAELTTRSNKIYQSIITNEFKTGTFAWLLAALEQDIRNHPVHPSRGHRIRFASRIAVPSFGSTISFFTTELEAHWFTPLIGERDLVLHLHGFVGAAQPINNNYTIPYGKLYHIGGDATVRGYGFGEISPKYIANSMVDSIGADKGFYLNAELVFPINPSMTMKGLLFYDGGSGWDNPYVPPNAPDNFINNGFDYRHAVGFGLRILQPMPIRIDWGFKIDPRLGEKSHQVHFGTSFDW